MTDQEGDAWFLYSPSPEVELERWVQSVQSGLRHTALTADQAHRIMRDLEINQATNIEYWEHATSMLARLCVLINRGPYRIMRDGSKVIPLNDLEQALKGSVGERV